MQSNIDIKKLIRLYEKEISDILSSNDKTGTNLTPMEIETLTAYKDSFNKYAAYLQENPRANDIFFAIQKKLNQPCFYNPYYFDQHPYYFNQIVAKVIDYDSGLYKYQILLWFLNWSAMAVTISGIVVLSLHMPLALGIPLLASVGRALRPTFSFFSCALISKKV